VPDGPDDHAALGERRGLDARGQPGPLGELPALWARTSLPNVAAQWFNMPSDRTLRAEL